MLTLKFVKRNETRKFDGDALPATPVHDCRLYDEDGNLVAETKVGYRDKHEASRAWTTIRDQIAASQVVIEGEVVEEEDGD